MLSRYQTSKACSRDLLQSLIQISAQGSSHQLLHHGRSKANTTLHQRRFSTTTFTLLESKKLREENTRRLSLGKRLVSSTTPSEEELAKRRDSVYTLIDNISQHEDQLAELLEELYLLDDYEHILNVESWKLDDVFSGTIGHRDYQTLEAKVRLIRQQFGETLPEGHLNTIELELYIRLYGQPIPTPEHSEQDVHEKEPNLLLRDDGQGGFEKVEYEQPGTDNAETSVVYNMDDSPQVEETSAMQLMREAVEQLNGELIMEQAAEEADSGSEPRVHPFTKAGRFSTNPSTVFLPYSTLTGPVSAILSNFSNKHIAEATHKAFGGCKLPHSTTTLPPAARVPQLPIPLTASQRHMGEMEANAYIAALYPGIYASTMSVLTEVRKRLGTKWIRGLINQDAGPRVLDAGGAGAGILAWRDVVRAEYELMVPDHPKTAPIPTTRSTVLAGSDALQSRASLLLENTTFLPRLPDYVHVRDTATLDDGRAPPKRRQYDVVIAPHSLLQIEEDYLRKQHVENLWSLLSPKGGVLILLEKGRQMGFDAIAGAREMLLERYISSPGSAEYESLTESKSDGPVKKEKGMIIAPCTNHEKCPMSTFSGKARGRSDYCRFQQRYIRPPFLQRIVGAKDHNHEDIEFSYVAVQRGVDLRQTEGIIQGREATEAAFKGYEDSSQADGGSGEYSGNTAPFNPLSLPRAVFPPMKRQGHVIFDFCTPEGKIERWTLPRSYSPLGHRDARKARWGDLWALGAKTRVPRNLRLGSPEDKYSKRKRLERRAASKLSEIEEEEDDFNALEEKENTADLPLVDALAEQADSVKRRKRGQTIPSWKKYSDKKRIRQASKRSSASSHDKLQDFA